MLNRIMSQLKYGATHSYLQIHKFKRRRGNCGKVKRKFNIIKKKRRQCEDNWKNLIIFKRLLSWKMNKRTNKEFLSNFKKKIDPLLKFNRTKRKRFKVSLKKTITKRRFMISTLNWNKQKIICEDFNLSKEKMNEAWNHSMKRSSCLKKSVEKWRSSSKKKKRKELI